MSDIEALWKLKQTRNLADDNLFGGLRVKHKEEVDKTTEHSQNYLVKEKESFWYLTFLSPYMLQGHSGVAWSHGELFDAEFGMSSTHARLAWKTAKHTYIL